MRFSFFLFYSLLAHCILLGFFYLLPEFPLPRLIDLRHRSFINISLINNTKNASQIEIYKKQNKDINKDETLKTQIRSALIPDYLKTLSSDDPLVFLSKETQRVREQLKALRSGITQNKLPYPQVNELFKNAPLKNKEKPQNFSEKKMNKENSQLEAHKKGEGLSLHLASPETHANTIPQQTGFSYLGEELPDDIHIGEMNILNTDRFTYYTFFARVEELIRFSWEHRLQYLVSILPSSYFSGVTEKWVTIVEILLDSKGRFHSAELLKESGIKEFDLAPIDAFISAKMFPNPPKDLIESDGLIHLKYSFGVRVRTKVLSRNRDQSF